MAGSECSAIMKEEDTRSPIQIEPTGSPGSEASQGHNGYHGATSGEDSLDNSYDAPLDFSVKKQGSEPDDDSTAGSVTARSPPPRPANGRQLEDTPSPSLKRRVNGPDLHADDSNSSVRSDSQEPPTGLVLPGLAGMPPLTSGLPNPAMLANLPIVTTADPRRSQGGNGKNLRPFKAYPKDPLSLPLGYYAIPGMLPIPGMDPATLQAMGVTSQEDLVAQYRQYLNKLQDVGKAGGRPKNTESSVACSPGSEVRTSVPITPPSTISNDVAASPASSTSSITSTPPAVALAGDTPTHTSSSSRKRGRTVSDEQKDSAYWDRRRKNNEAAKRSRDARRAKEDEIAIRAALLEQENLKLRVEVAALKNETAKLRCMLYNS